MKTIYLLVLFCISLVILSCQNKESTAKLKNADVQSIAFLGGSLIAEMEDFGYFERALHLQFPNQKMKIRNIAWPADDVFGKARSQFGSAQNTQSWKPPTAEEGFGSKVLLEHVEEVQPKTLFVGYGSEAAFFKNEKEITLFKNGYQRLLDTLESRGINLVLISPPKQERIFFEEDEIIKRNKQLGAVSDFIKKEANSRGHLLVDLFNELVTETNKKFYTYNGVQLNSKGYEKMSEVLRLSLDMKDPALKLDKKNKHLLAVIKEKNRLHRYLLQPLNEAYIYLFRRHEMGHLASEMEDLKNLIEEKEREIKALVNDRNYNPPKEIDKPWEAPKTYQEHEVPAFIPEPNVEEEIAAFNIADGYEINLFAADPMIANPININWDTKGRAWVATSSTYPHIVPGKEPNDKIIILEDTDRDGIADKHTVFAENLLVPHSVMPVPGGAYVVSTTEVLFFADANGDDIPEERRVVYKGFGNADVHHTIHGLRWTPWGDLHFTQSIYINSFVNTPYGVNVLNGSGTWSFRPEIEHLEVFSRGLVNPWGEAFDQWGQAFATDGAGGSGMNYIFPESAHMTAVGASKVIPGLNNGTPKNTAAEVIYSSHFPKDWQGSVITNDYRANRTVRYEIKPLKSGYQSKEVQTVLQSDHRSYRPVDSKIGPDGALYVVDWYNPIIAHGEVDFHHPSRDRLHGRIWKLTKKGQPLLEDIYFARTPSSDLLELLKSTEQFTRLQANRAYVERGGEPEIVVDWMNHLNKNDANFAHHRLEGLWLLTALNYYHEETLVASLKSSNPRERAAAVRVLSHWKKQGDHLSLLKRMIKDKHPQVRLETIHALRELGTKESAEIAMKVKEMEMDENLNFALDLTLAKLQNEWLPAFAKNEKPFAGEKNNQLYALLNSEDARVIQPINDLLAKGGLDKELTQRAWLLLAKIGDVSSREKVLQKALDNEDSKLLSAIANAPKANDAIPENLNLLESLITHKDEEMRLAALRVAGRCKASIFSDLILKQLRIVKKKRERLFAMRTLDKIGQEAEVEQMAQSETDKDIRGVACIVWAERDRAAAAASTVNLLSVIEDPSVVESIFSVYRRTEEGPMLLVNALKGKTIPEPIASVGLRMIQTSGLPLPELEKAIRASGNISPIGMEMTKEEKAALIKDALATGDQYRGSKLYRKKELLCATCHRVNNMGGLSGPDLSTIGSFMTPPAILDAILNPNNDIKQGYETVILTKNDGEIISGLLDRKTDKATLIRLANSEIVEVPAAEIAKIDVSPMSLMPVGLTRNLHKDELKDLLAYLMKLGVK